MSSITAKQGPGTVQRDGAVQSAGKVLMGTCGWSDASIVQCGRFYPRSVKTSEDRLRVYSTHFPCVEVDTSCYAIPRPDVTRKWAQSTPAGFKFHVKAFGMFCSQGCNATCLPAEVRNQLPAYQHSTFITLDMLPQGGEKLLWNLFHAALEPIIKLQRMGCVLFQFHLSFKPTDSNRRYVEHCRAMLAAHIPMAVEFRDRAWFQDEQARHSLVAWLSGLGICLVAADELRHETFQKDREQTGLQPGQVRELMPIALEVTQPAFFFARLHRRHGTVDRLLPGNEIEAWAQRLANIAPKVKGPMYFLWGTDWEDAPVVNARKLQKALPAALAYDWKVLQRAAKPAAGSIRAFFSVASQKQRAQQQQQQQQDEAGESVAGADDQPDAKRPRLQAL